MDKLQFLVLITVIFVAHISEAMNGSANAENGVVWGG